MDDLESCSSVSYGTSGHAIPIHGRIGHPSRRVTGYTVGIVSAWIEIDGVEYEYEGVEAEAIIGILAVRIP